PHIPTERQRELAEEIAANPIRWGSEKMARALQVTIAERDLLGLCTIGAIDMTKAERKARQRKRRNEAKAKDRHKKGGRTREEYLTIAALEPWEFEGISKRTWERNGRAVNGLALALLCLAKIKTDDAETDSRNKAKKWMTQARDTY